MLLCVYLHLSLQAVGFESVCVPTATQHPRAIRSREASTGQKPVPRWLSADGPLYCVSGHDEGRFLGGLCCLVRTMAWTRMLLKLFVVIVWLRE